MSILIQKLRWSVKRLRLGSVRCFSTHFIRTVPSRNSSTNLKEFCSESCRFVFFLCTRQTNFENVAPKGPRGTENNTYHLCKKFIHIVCFNLSFTFSIRAYLYLLNDSIILIFITIIMKISLGVEAGLRYKGRRVKYNKFLSNAF